MIDHGDDEELQNAIVAVNRYYQEHKKENRKYGGRSIMEYRRSVIDKGVISLSDDLVITSGYTFDQFRATRYYKGQKPERVFWLDEKFMFQGHSFMVSLFFRSGVIYMLSLLCCDLEFGMEEEKKRKELHDEILQSWGIGRYRI